MAKAMHETALAECTQRYGALAKTKMVPGIVFETIKEVNRGNGRSTTYVVADFYFGHQEMQADNKECCEFRMF